MDAMIVPYACLSELRASASIGEQLGSKLESRRKSVDVIVVDHIEAPSPN
jgi:uncharacterized protein (TIGR03435 family)